ncbi:MAG: M28 family peptidase [Gemmatimonadales bacterium]
MRLLPLVLLLTACSGQRAPAPEIDGAAALEYVRQQLAFGPRIPGTEGHARMVAWLDSLLRTRADTVLRQEWSHRTRAGTEIPQRNLIARFNSAASTRLLFLAHFDTRPRADGGASTDTLAPVPGANDGASGVAVLLAMADALKSRPPAIGVDLLFVDGEDYGDWAHQSAAEGSDVLIGSRYYAQNLPLGGKPSFAVLLDMVGDRSLRIQKEGNSLTAAPQIVERVWSLARRMGYDSVFVDEAGIALTDDHLPLQQAGIPAIDVIDFDFGLNNSWWHTPEDTIDKVSARSLKIVGDVMMGLVRQGTRS